MTGTFLSILADSGLDSSSSDFLSFDSPPITQETWVQSQVESCQRLKKWYLIHPCLKPSIIRYGSRVKWSNPEKGVAPLHLGVVAIEKRDLGSPSSTVANNFSQHLETVLRRTTTISILITHMLHDFLVFCQYSSICQPFRFYLFPLTCPTERKNSQV